MSVVAARIYEDRIEVAADTICVRGSSKMNSAEKKHTKLFRFQELVVGGVSEPIVKETIVIDDEEK